MNSTDIIAYVHDGAVYHPFCAWCFTSTDEASPVFCGKETDGIMSCDRCHEWIDGYTLTSDGIALVQSELGFLRVEQQAAIRNHEPLIGVEHRQELIDAYVELLKDHGISDD